MNKKVIIPGTFDPITIGHYDIVKRAAKNFDEVLVVILNNVAKKTLFTLEERIQLIELAVSDLKNVSVDASDLLLTEFMKEKKIKIILKGLRNSNDLLYEADMAYINKKLDNQIETIFMLTKPKYQMISSSAVRELIKFGADLSGFVPKRIEKEIYNLLDKKKM